MRRVRVRVGEEIYSIHHVHVPDQQIIMQVREWNETTRIERI